jgi:hypothetical protein
MRSLDSWRIRLTVIIQVWPMWGAGTGDNGSKKIQSFHCQRILEHPRCSPSDVHQVFIFYCSLALFHMDPHLPTTDHQ